MNEKIRRRGSRFAGLAFVLLLSNLSAQTFVEETYEDFADGKLDAAGQNLYVSRDGSVRTIHRFDLNQDGFIDLVFNNTHDRRAFIPATSATVSSGGKILESAVAVEGSRQTVVADLNRDGHLDLVFCPNASGVQTRRRFLTLAYGGPDGWPPQRTTGLLPVHDARKVAVTDLNADEWPDIVTLNSEAWLPGQPSGGPILRMYWGSKDGFLLTRRLDMQVEGALDIAAADIDQDGMGDLAVLTGQKRIVILWGGELLGDEGRFEREVLNLPGSGAATLAAADASGEGRPDLVVGSSEGQVYLFRRGGGRGSSTAQVMPGFPASHVSVGEVDGDDLPEIVLTHFEQNRAGGGEASGAAAQSGASVRILWGSDGWDHTRATALDVPYATATAIGDLDDDGQADLAIAVHQNDETYRAMSSVLLGQGGREFRRLSGPSTEGAMHVAIAPKTRRHPARAVFANILGGTVGERIKSQVFWGSAAGFSDDNQWMFDMRSGYEHSAADLNADGYVDLLVLNSGHAGAAAANDPTLGANIFWGGAEGFDPATSRTVLNEPGLGSTNVADLNRDGYLDITLGSFDVDAPLVIYYGSSDGYSRDRRQTVSSPGRSVEGVIADFNGDDWLDIAVVSFTVHRVRIFWGGPEGFDASRQGHVAMPSPIGLETADLNRDGRLDLIVASYQDPLARHHDTGMMIFWGQEGGFHSANSQWLPGFTPISPVVADFDADGFLDIFSPHYHSDLTRELLPNYIYWGSRNGFAARDRAALICDSADDALAADFDKDGALDIALACHTSDGDHTTHSKVFYNDGRRFENPRVEKLLTYGPHWMGSQDMGHIAHRRWEQTYESSVFEWDGGAARGRLTSEADWPAGAGLSFEVRSAGDAKELAERPWRRLAEGSFQLESADRVLQYRVAFHSPNGDSFATLRRVEIRLTP
ncbi:MAG: VCBS repeat-containing protein [Acidobacteriia bacterium]|nr:VCBS repeat-containing protein [Terriglobia bacterium]